MASITTQITGDTSRFGKDAEKAVKEA